MQGQALTHILQHTDESLAHDTDFSMIHYKAVGKMFYAHFNDYSYEGTDCWEGNKLKNINESGIKQFAKYL